MKSSPYLDLPSYAFWKSGVADVGSAIPPDLYTKKWQIHKTDRIATAGSCFAQHIGRTLKARGYAVIDVEPPPSGLPASAHSRFGYGIYSARYGNVYTARQFLQLVESAISGGLIEDCAWQRPDGRWVDALRPAVEPEGLNSVEEVQAHRVHHLKNVRTLLTSADLVVFTLGLTEAWINKHTGTVYPTAPGTIAGNFDPETYIFHNFRVSEIVADIARARALIHSIQEKPCKFLFTVSPVPLTATATPHHVMVATMGSKAILRAAAAELYEDFEDVDYFPSYEIIMNPWMGVSRYESNLRSVRKDAVEAVMDTFVKAHEGSDYSASKNTEKPRLPPQQTSIEDPTDVVCEEALLEAFGKKDQA